MTRAEAAAKAQPSSSAATSDFAIDHSATVPVVNDRTAAKLFRGLGRRPTSGPLAGFVIVYIFFAVFAGQNQFLTLAGTASWVNFAAELGIIALPIGLLLISGEFDLSIAAVLSAASLITAVGTGTLGLPLFVAILIALGFSVVVGLVNGYLVVKTGLPSLIITIGTMFVLAGASLTIVRAVAGTTAITMNTTDPLSEIFGGKIYGFNASVLWFALIAVACGILLSSTRFGNWVFAVGGDKESAREAGVPVARVKIVLFVFTALGAGLLGVIQAITYNGASVGAGTNYIFYALIAAVIGGVLLNGGFGTATGIALGTMTFALVQTGVAYTGWPSDLSQVFIGCLVLIAVVVNDSARRALLRNAD